MSTNGLIALASLLTGLGATSAAVVAAYALRSQQRSQQRQHDLENLRWLSNEYAALRELRQRAAAGLLDGKRDDYALREVLNFFESCGFMVREGYITAYTFSETIGAVPVPGWWYAAESVIGMGRERVSPTVFEHYEWLKDQLAGGNGAPDSGWVKDFLRREATLSIFDVEPEPEASSA